MKQAIVSNSLTQVHFSELSTSNVSAYLEWTDDEWSAARTDASKNKAFQDLLRRMQPDELTHFKTGLASISDAAHSLGSGTARVLNKLGPLAAGLGFLVASMEAGAAESAGNSEQAKEIMAVWAVDAAGSGAAEFVAGALATAGLAALAAAGVTVSLPVAGAMVFGATLLGGFFGGDAAVEFYHLLDDRDANGRRDIIDKLSNLFFGATSTITTPLPADLNGGEQYMVDASFSADDMVEHARSSIAWRYALRELNSFVIEDLDYTRHDNDGSLDLYDPATGAGAMTEDYLEDRAAMLAWKLLYESEGAADDDDDDTAHTLPKPYDEEWDTRAVQGNWDFVDLSIRLPGGAPLTLAIDGTGLSLSDHQVVFGSGNGEAIEGGGETDALYGMGGNDRLVGKGDDDHLEGGAGADTLEGGEGADTLLGGAGDDRLEGGAGGDQLDGGAGADTYIVAAGSSTDTVLSSDVADRLQFDGRVLTGQGTLRSRSASLTVWVDDSVAASPITYVHDTLRGELAISGSGSTVLVRDFASGDLGIAVPGEPAPRPVPATVQLIDFANTSGLVSRLSDWNRSGLPAATFINISAGWYRVEGGRNGDVLVGGSVLAPGEHTFGGIELVGRAGDDHLYAVAEQTEAQALAGTPALPPGPTAVEGPMLDGGQGDDFIVGSASDDLSFGGAGDDRIITGDGNDMVLSDGDLGPTFNTAAEFGQAPSVMTGGNSAGLDGGALNWRWLRGVSQKEYLLDVVAHPGYSLDGYSINLGSHAIDPLDDLDLRVFASDTFVPFALPPDHALYAAFVEAHPGVEPGSFDLVLRGHSRGAGFNTFGFDRNDPDPQTRLLDSFSTARYSGADVISTGAGDDVVNAGGGNDVVDAGADQDVVAGYDGDDVVDGGSGDDLLFGDYLADPGGTGAGPIPLIDGLSGLARGRRGLDPSRHGNDRLDGGEGRDHLIGGGGTDLLYGGEGNDELEGDEYGLAAQWTGNDRLDGGVGNDTLIGGGRDDDLLGGTGDDVLMGDADIESVAADAQGSDRLDGGAGNDHLYGGGRNDVLIGGIGDDQILGDDFEDKLPGELHGNDQLDGGEGNDSLLGGGGDDRILGGAGDDWLSGEDQEDTAAVSALQGDDLLDGGEGNDTLAGGNGRDLLIGGDGDDLLFGGDGDDVLDGGAGLDGMKGGAGDDRYVIRAGDVLPVQLADGVQLAETLDDSQGRNRLVLADGAAVSGVQDAGDGDLLLSLGAGRLVVKGGLRGAVVAVESGQGPAQTTADLARQYLNSTITLETSVAGQWLIGGRAADTLSAQHAGSRLEGGLGNDQYNYNGSLGGTTVALRSGDGVDRLIGSAALEKPPETPARADNVIELGAGIARDSVHLVQRSVNGSLRLALDYGNAGDSAVIEFGGTDAASAYASFDRIDFADGSSMSFMDLAAQGIRIGARPYASGTFLGDVFSGDAGGNSYTGLAGNDTYWFGRGDGRDTISAQDRGVADVETVQFRAGVAPADLQWVRRGNDLLVRIRGTSGGTGDELAVLDAFGSNPIETFRFADGSVLRQADLVLASMADQATEGDDTIWGGPLAESVDSGAGYDSVNAGAGNDTVLGGSGDDTLYGGAGDDALDGGAGFDILQGDDGSDRLAGGVGDDRLSGGAGNDTLLGGAAGDELFGEAGDDWLEDDGARSDVTGRGARLVGGGGLDTYRLVRSGGLEAGLSTSDVASVVGGADGGDRLILAGVDVANVTVRRRGSSDLWLALTGARGEEQFAVTLVGQGRADTVAPRGRGALRGREQRAGSLVGGGPAAACRDRHCSQRQPQRLRRRGRCHERRRGGGFAVGGERQRHARRRRGQRPVVRRGRQRQLRVCGRWRAGSGDRPSGPGRHQHQRHPGGRRHRICQCAPGAHRAGRRRCHAGQRFVGVASPGHGRADVGGPSISRPMARASPRSGLPMARCGPRPTSRHVPGPA